LAFTPLLVCIVLALPSLKEPHALKEIPALVMTLVQMSPLLILLLMAVALFLSAPLLANLWLVILRRVGGLPVSAGQVFRRLSNSYGEVLKVYFAQVFLLLALTMPFKWLLPRLLSGSAWTPWLSALSWSLRTLIEIAILTAFMFALPLAAERGLRWRSAIRTSCGIVKQHWLGLIWFVLIANVPSILSDVPLLAGVKVVKNAALDMRVALYLIIGVFACLSVLLAPFAQTALVFAYEGIFGRRSRPPDTAR
jgi:membrane-anchored glycerophosphoryl diester phosphodiesterase (GDPDase)